MTSAADGWAEYSSCSHVASVVVVANHADEPHDGSRRLMAHQLLVFGKQNRLIRQRGTHDQRHRRLQDGHPTNTNYIY